MKKLILFILPALFFFSCKNSQDASFSVSGTIKNANGKQIILNKFTSDKTLKLDTVEIDTTGKFTISGNTSAPELFSLELAGDKGQILFIADSLDNLTIDADAKNFRTDYKISGSKDSELLKEMYDNLDITYLKIDSLNQIYLSKKENSDLDSLNTAISAQYQKIVEKHKSNAIKFIENNIGSPSVLMALYQSMGPKQQVFSLEEDRDIFEKVNESLSKKYPKSGFVKGLSDLLEKNPPVVGKPKIGTLAPEISEVNPDGKKITLSSLRGNYVLLDFWASWCRPCRGENPNVVKTFKKYKSKGFTVYQVSLDQKKEDWIKAIEKDGLEEWTHVSDLQYWQAAPAKRYGIRSIPSNFLLNPEGKIIAVDLRGPYLGQKLQEIYGF